MSKKIKSDAEDFNNLKELGFEFEAPQDEFSYQPDSGSIASGDALKQEYGIDVDLDAQSANSRVVKGKNIQDPSVPIPGQSEWSQKHRHPADEIEDEFNSENDNALLTLVNDQIDLNTQLAKLDITVQVKDGVVTLGGKVKNETTKLLVSKIIEKLPGLTSLNNELSIL